MSDLDDLDAQLLAQMRDDFLIESQEILERLGPSLAELEREGHPDLLKSLFRDVHTLKGTAGFVGLVTFQTLAHKLEDLFGALRDETLGVTPELIDVIFEGVKVLSDLRDDVARGGSGERDIASLVEHLERALEAKPLPALSEADAFSMDDSPESSQEDTFRPESTLRVKVDLLDRLIMLVGELITARNALQASAERLQDAVLIDQTSVIGRLIRSLQTEVTNMRLIPVARLFERFTGVVRTLGREHGKEVNLRIEGGDTPVDRTVFEQMYEPLVHLLRNAIDHGLESPEERRKVGKPKTAKICLSAERQGDVVVIRVADDGRGIDPDRVREMAIGKGVLSPAEIAALSDDQVVRLIFRSGFSTKNQVTGTSGRGVGLDVVVEHVRRLRGSLDIETRLGEGTTFILQLPLTLAILQVLLARVGERVYAFPLHVVRETLQIERSAIRTMQRGQVLSLRDEVLPLYRLGDRLHAREQDDDKSVEHAVVVHLATGDEIWIIDELVGKQQVVVQTLPAYLGTVRGVEGAAVLPDGAVTLILDVEGLAWE